MITIQSFGTMRKSLAISFVVVQLAACIGQVSAAGFSDTTGTEYDAAFTVLAARAVIRGYADGLARPTLPMTRAEALKIMIEANGVLAPRLASLKKRMPPIALFSDIDQKQWYAPLAAMSFFR